MFLWLFEELAWVVLIALIIPFVDSISVAAGPTHTIVTHHFAVYSAVAVAFVAPGGRAAGLGPPDILFFALFLAATVRWQLRPGWTWLAMTGMYALTWCSPTPRTSTVCRRCRSSRPASCSRTAT